VFGDDSKDPAERTTVSVWHAGSEWRGDCHPRGHPEDSLAGSTIVDFDHSINVPSDPAKGPGRLCNNPHYIETLARRGYRLMVPVSGWNRLRRLLRVTSQLPNHPRRWWKAAIVGAFALILVVAGYMSWRHFRPATPTASGRITLAVLPFKNLTGDPNQEYLADGLTEEMISPVSPTQPEQLV